MTGVFFKTVFFGSSFFSSILGVDFFSLSDKSTKSFVKSNKPSFFGVT